VLEDGDKDALEALGNRMTFGLLGEPKRRDIVVPADLDKAEMPDVEHTPPPMPLDTSIRRRVWPWFVAGGVACVAVTAGIVMLKQKWAREEYEKKYPVANSPFDEQTIAARFAKWRVPVVIELVGTPPKLESLMLGAPCDTDIEYAREVRAGDTDALKATLAWVFDAARRGRYHDERDRDLTLRDLARPILVVELDQVVSPELTNRKTYASGFTSGSAWLVDTDGTLLCAGKFEAASSDKVEVTYYESGNKVIGSTAEESAPQAIRSDLGKNTQAAIRAGLRKVQR
jgi:hypothetical protein